MMKFVVTVFSPTLLLRAGAIIANARFSGTKPVCPNGCANATLTTADIQAVGVNAVTVLSLWFAWALAGVCGLSSVAPFFTSFAEPQPAPLRRQFLTAALLLLLAAASPAGAQSAGTLDALNANVVGGYVLAKTVQPDGKTIIAGLFSSVLGVSRNNIARLNADGTLDMGFDPKANSQVNGVSVQADGKILLSGFFTTLQPNGAPDGTFLFYIARVNADGSLDMGFFPRPNNVSRGALVQADGKILLWGSFTTLQPNGVASPITRHRIARVNADGSLDTAFDPKPNGNVESVALQADGKILLGGSFSVFQPNGAPSGTTRNNIARVNADGSLDLGFDPNANTTVYSVAAQADGKILLAGDFTTLQPNGAASTTNRSYNARVNADGTLDQGFDPKANSTVRSLAVQADGKILLAGDFTTLQPNGAAGATNRNYIARMNANGSLDTAFDPRANGIVYGTAVQADGKVLLGGLFTTLQPNGAASPTTRNGFARLINDPATEILSVPDMTQVLWQRGGAAPEVSLVTFEQSIDGGANWTALGNGTRVGTTSNWQLTGLNLPANGQIRARGRTTGGNFNNSSGLVETLGLLPTASGVSVGGFVLTQIGRAPRLATVTLTDLNGNRQETAVNRFGHYTFTEVAPGQTYFLTVTAKGYNFTPPTQVVTPNFDITELNFTAFANSASRGIRGWGLEVGK